MADHEEKFEHPAMGLLALSRLHGSHGTSLFGSRVKHSETVKITLRNAEMRRSLSRDWYAANDIIAQVEMSPAQWAEFVSSFGMGDGVPVTIRYKRTGEFLECPPYEEPQTTFEAHEIDLNRAVEEGRKMLNQMMAEIDALGDAPGKKKIAELRRNLKIEIGNLLSNLPFIGNSLKKSMDATVQEAKIEMDAFAQNHVILAGLRSIAENKAIAAGSDASASLPPSDTEKP